MSNYSEDIRKVYALDIPWDKLKGSNILITGSTGLIGSCLVDMLMNYEGADYSVYAGCRNTDKAKKRFEEYLSAGNFHIIQFDVTDHIESDINFDYIIHCASGASPNAFAVTPVDVMKANIFGTDNLINYGLKSNMKRLVFISSGEVYGEGDGRPFTEDYSGYVNSTLSRSCYPSSKRAAETLCASYISQYGADIVIARPCHIYGPHYMHTDNRAYAQFFNNAVEGNDIVLKSKGEQFRSWIYVVDCASAILHILTKGGNGEAYNIADEDSNLSILELATKISAAAGRKVIFDLPSESETKGFSKVTKAIFDSSKIKSLGWKKIATIDEGIRNTYYTLTDK